MRSVKRGGKKQTRYRYKRNNINSKSKALKKKHDTQTNWLTNAAFTGYRLTPNPEVAAQWNKRLTLKQNMDNMGLAYDANKTTKAPKTKARKEHDVEDVPMEVVAEVSSVAQQKAEANKNKREAKKANKEQKGKKATPMEIVDEPMFEEPQPSKPQTKEPEPPKEKQQKKEKQKEVEQPKSQPSQQKEQKKGKKEAVSMMEEEQPMEAEESIASRVVANHANHFSAKENRAEETTATNNNNNNDISNSQKIKKQASQEKAEKQTKAEKTKQAAAPAAIVDDAPIITEQHAQHEKAEKKGKGKKTKHADLSDNNTHDEFMAAEQEIRQEPAEKQSKVEKTKQATAPTTVTNGSAMVVEQEVHLEQTEKQTKGKKNKQAAATTHDEPMAAVQEVQQKSAEKQAKVEKTKAGAAPAVIANGSLPKAAEEKKQTPAPAAVVDKPKPAILALEKAAAEEEVRQKKERMYRLLPQDILFCTRMMETHGDDYEAMARDSRNIYQDTGKQIQRKIRIFRESPQYQLYVEAKNEGKTYPNGEIEAK